MKKAAKMKQTVNDTLLNALVEKMEPDWVFVNGNFLLIVLSQKLGRPLTDYKAILQNCLKDCGEIAGAIVFTNELEKSLSDGHLLYSALCKKEYLIYSAGVGTLPLTLWQKTGRIIERANASFQLGHQRAAAFLDGAAFFFDGHRISLSLFMLHQAAEQAIRCFLIAVLGQDIRTHSLNDLRKHLKKCDGRLSSFLAAREEQPLFTLLDNAYSASRYMDGFTCDANEVAQLLCKVKTFLNDVGETFTKIVWAVSTLR